MRSHLPRPYRLLLICALIIAFSIAAIPAHATGVHARLVVANVLVSHDHYRAHSEPAVAENPRNHNNLVAGSKFFTDPTRYRFKIGTMYSMNGGRSWHDSGWLPGFDGFHTVSDISIAFAPNGTAYVTVLACDGGICPGSGLQSGVFVSRSTDGGKSFTNPVAVFQDDSGDTFSDKPWMAVDNSRGPSRGTVYVAWNLDPTNGGCNFDQNGDAVTRQTNPGGAAGGIVVSRSTDGGRSFSAPVTIFPFTAQQEGIGADPVVGTDGHVEVAFATVSCSGQAIQSIDVVKSVDAGVTFSDPLPIQKSIAALPFHLANSTFRSTTLPTLAVSPSTGTMVIAWADARNGDADILASTSRNGGANWSTPARINHDAIRSGKDQFMPALAVSPNGTFTCAWFDRRFDPANRLIDEVVAQSQDDGSTFGSNLRVTQHSWDPAIDAPLPEGRTDRTFIGDYQALAVDNATIHPLWNDTQNGRTQEIRTAIMSVRLFSR